MKNKGITLIALVITIIILLILAGITLTLVVGDNGILKHAKNAVNAYEQTQINEINDLNMIEEEIDNVIGSQRMKLEARDVGTSSITIAIKDIKNETEVKEYVYIVNGIEKGRSQNKEYTIEDLEAETKYSVIVKAIYSDNKENVSNTLHLKTQARVYLYQLGNEYIDITGGWVKDYFGVKDYGFGIFIKNSDNLYIKNNGTSTNVGYSNYHEGCRTRRTN